MPLATRQPRLSFPITVRANDRGPAASGVSYDAIFAADDGGTFKLWTTVPGSDPTAVYTGRAGHTYAFKSIAHDFAGNVEKTPLEVETKTTLPGQAISKNRGVSRRERPNFKPNAGHHVGRREPVIVHTAAPATARAVGPAGPLALARSR